MRQSLHRRLLFWLFSVVVFSTVIVMMLFIQDANRRVASFRLSHAIHQAKALSEASRDALVTEDYGLINSLVSASVPDETYAYASLVLPDGKILSHTNIDKIGHEDEAPQSDLSKHLSTTVDNNRLIQVISTPIVVADELLGYAKVAFYVDSSKQLDDETIQSIIGIIMLMVTLLVVGSFLVSRRIVKPIDELTDIISNFDVQNEELRINSKIWDRKDEVGKLARAFKLMQMDVVEYVEKLRVEIGERHKAESANKTKSDFLANMSHELRTPLNAIIGYSEILMEEHVEDGDYIDLQKIRSSGIHLLQLIDNLLDLSKIEAGRMELDCKDLFLPDVIKEVTEIFQSQIQENNNELIVNIDPLVGHGCLDSVKIKQILYNLLSNAGKFTLDGKIILNAGVEKTAGTYNYTIEVSDEGIGMTQEQCDKVFSPYVQADNSTASQFGGTGLGLTITKKFCEMMGGEIAVSSEIGIGSVFRVTLPIKTMRKMQTA